MRWESWKHAKSFWSSIATFKNCKAHEYQGVEAFAKVEKSRRGLAHSQIDRKTNLKCVPGPDKAIPWFFRFSTGSQRVYLWQETLSNQFGQITWRAAELPPDWSWVALFGHSSVRPHGDSALAFWSGNCTTAGTKNEVARELSGMQGTWAENARHFGLIKFVPQNRKQ